ncbi:hypothetical protein CKO28_03250 [Rhodovibrio sodomensis]|uniref:Uncharacterized protein n=1 Tax=Rhodovibrio sodomensis TaxID=1088 RepID=A0ABS1DAW0_9PROT|nr:hypothetical protein [Rhodovibrio sodomensis]MBK1667061.1 hypothetical protein [Rhodovibrio sodomensis]
MAAIKLTREVKNRLRANLKDAQAAEAMEMAEHGTALLHETAVRLLAERWGAPEVQTDMLVLARHQVASAVRGVNLKVAGSKHSPMGAEIETDILVPDKLHLGTYPWFTVPENDPAHGELLRVQNYAHSHRSDQEAERAALEDAFRKTSSLARLQEIFPRSRDLLTDDLKAV